MDKFVAGSLNMTPIVSFRFIQTLFLMVPLRSTVSHLRPRFAYILGSYGHVRGQGGHHPAVAKPPFYIRILVVKNTSNPNMQWLRG